MIPWCYHQFPCNRRNPDRWNHNWYHTLWQTLLVNYDLELQFQLRSLYHPDRSSSIGWNPDVGQSKHFRLGHFNFCLLHSCLKLLLISGFLSLPSPGGRSIVKRAVEVSEFAISSSEWNIFHQNQTIYSTNLIKSYKSSEYSWNELPDVVNEIESEISNNWDYHRECETGRNAILLTWK